MDAPSASLNLRQVPILLRGEVEPISRWLEQWDARRAWLCLAVILAGAGAYGAAMGCWRSPWQAGYVALKFPLIILLTTLGNALLNGMLAPLLGLNLRFRQSLLAILMSFTIAAAILGAFSPIIFFLVWNLPPMTADAQARHVAYDLLMLTQVAAIAFAGVVANLRLVQLLRRVSGSAAVAWKVLLGWLAGNLFLGSQLCWICRPFFGAPHLPVEFLRPDAFHGNFYESVFRAMRELLFR